MSSEARKALDQAREAIRIVAQKPITKIEQYRLVADNARLKRQLETERAARLANEAELVRADAVLGELRQKLANVESELRLLKAGRPDDAVKLPA